MHINLIFGDIYLIYYERLGPHTVALGVEGKINEKEDILVGTTTTNVDHLEVTYKLHQFAYLSTKSPRHLREGSPPLQVLLNRAHTHTHPVPRPLL